VSVDGDEPDDSDELVDAPEVWLEVFVSPDDARESVR
jgi:hypothetical protein